MSSFGRFTTMKLTICIVTVCSILATGIKASPQEPRRSGLNGAEPIDIGMVTLLASPERYDGQRVRIIGYLCLEFEGNAIYLHAEDYKLRLTKNAVALNLSKEEELKFKAFTLKYVLIEGTVTASRASAERGIYTGSIGRITRLEYWRPRADATASQP